MVKCFLMMVGELDQSVSCYFAWECYHLDVSFEIGCGTSAIDLVTYEIDHVTYEIDHVTYETVPVSLNFDHMTLENYCLTLETGHVTYVIFENDHLICGIGHVI